MKEINRKLYFKKIGELTQEEFELLFNISTDINDPNFRKILEPIAEQSISDIDIEKYDISSLNFNTAYLLGNMNALKQKIPQNHLITLFGESGCGKSYLIHLVSKLKEMDLNEIKEDRQDLRFASREYETNETIRELKQMADSINIIQKKTTRPSRDGQPNKIEIQEGMSQEEVQKCDWTYTMGGNLYGFSKEEIDDILNGGDAIVIVNDIEIMRELKKAYPKNLLPIQVYRTATKEEWMNMMKQDNRTKEEIMKRAKQFGYTTEIYKKLWEMEYPDTIFNMPGVTADKLLQQLKAVIQRKDKRLERIEEWEK